MYKFSFCLLTSDRFYVVHCAQKSVTMFSYDFGERWSCTGKSVVGVLQLPMSAASWRFPKELKAPVNLVRFVYKKKDPAIDIALHNPVPFTVQKQLGK